MTGTYIIAAPNYMTDPLTETRVCGGSWSTSFPISNLGAEFFTEKSVSTNDDATSTWFECAFSDTRDLKVLAIPNCNASSAAIIRYLGSNIAAWDSVSLASSASIGATSLSVTSTENVTFRKGQGFTVASGGFYEITADLSLGENDIKYSEELTNAVWEYNLGGATHTVTGGKPSPDGRNNAVEIEWVSGGTGLFRQYAPATLATYTDYNVSFWVKPIAYTAVTGDSILSVDISDSASIQFISESDAPLNEWTRVSVNVTSGAGGGSTNWLDINGGFGTTYYKVQIWGVQVTNGSGVKPYAKSGSAVVSSATGTLAIRQAHTTSEGLAAALTSGAVLTAQCGDYASESVFDTGDKDYYDVLYPFGLRSWGSSGVWDGFGSPEDRAALYITNQNVQVLENVSLCKYVSCFINDTANADGYITIDAFYACSAYVPTYGASVGTQFGLKSNSSRVDSEGGVSAFKRNKATRQVSLKLEHYSIEEAFTNVFDLQRELDITEDLYFIFDSDDTELFHRRTFPARFDTLSMFTYQYPDRISVEINVIERLA